MKNNSKLTLKLKSELELLKSSKASPLNKSKH